MVMSGGFCWRGETYDSLSTIAPKITGVSWNGPRFFGLRARKDSEAVAVWMQQIPVGCIRPGEYNLMLSHAQDAKVSSLRKS
jgi:hypothetical protein